MLPAFGSRDPDDRGYFGDYGGRFVPETLVAPIEELEKASLKLLNLNVLLTTLFLFVGFQLLLKK